MRYAVQAEGLVKRYGETRALDGVDLEVPEGRLLGVLGPNGAGKTTAVRILATLLRPDGGRATVGGFDVGKESHKVRTLIGLTGQYAAVDEALTGVENIVMIGRLLGLSRADAKRRAGELLERFDLSGAASRAAKTYSGGMRRRLDLAASLVGLGGNNQCYKLSVAGDPCNPLLSQGSCVNFDDVCDPGSSTCAPAPGPGAPCVSDRCMRFAECVEGTCVARPRLGEPCDGSVQCLGELYCNNGFCEGTTVVFACLEGEDPPPPGDDMG
jgi:ABC-type transport system involved in cytochrome c biogenesis ATPase subunit